MVSRSWQNYPEGPQNCPQGRGFCLFFLPRGRNFAKIFCPGAGNLTSLKNSLGVSPGGGCWCLELTDALSTCLLQMDFKGHTTVIMESSDCVCLKANAPFFYFYIRYMCAESGMSYVNKLQMQRGVYFS